MRTFRENLIQLMKDQGISQRKMAKMVGLQSQTAVSYVLTGKRKFNRDLLNLMCEALGISVLELSAMSSDLQIAKTKESTRAAALVDDMTPENRALAIALLEQLASKK